jgi:hypothetical protein
VKQRRLNFTTVVDPPAGASILTGIFSIRGHPITIILDSEVNHSFIIVKIFQVFFNLDTIRFYP